MNKFSHGTTQNNIIFLITDTKYFGGPARKNIHTHARNDGHPGTSGHKSVQQFTGGRFQAFVPGCIVQIFQASEIGFEEKKKQGSP